MCVPMLSLDTKPKTVYSFGQANGRPRMSGGPVARGEIGT